MTTKEYTIFVGYDSRQDDFYKLCEHSLRSHSDSKLNIIPLKHLELRKKGLFTRPWQIEGTTGQFIDMVDKKPFSTEFSHSRFLTPTLAKSMGLKGFVMFVDSDFIFQDDVAELFHDVEVADLGTKHPLYVAKHNYQTNKTLKMDNKAQVNYDKKLWSSLMVFNIDHPDNAVLNKNLVNTADGRYLHTFKWLDKADSSADSHIGTISERFNFIPEHSEARVADNMIGAIHFTEGGPSMKGYEFCKYSDVYREVEEQYYLDRYMAATNSEYELKVIK